MQPERNYAKISCVYKRCVAITIASHLFTLNKTTFRKALIYKIYVTPMLCPKFFGMK